MVKVRQLSRLPRVQDRDSWALTIPARAVVVMTGPERGLRFGCPEWAVTGPTALTQNIWSRLDSENLVPAGGNKKKSESQLKPASFNY